MLIDTRLTFSASQALTASAASTDRIDLETDRDIGPGRTLYLVMNVEVAADATTGNETYQVTLQTDTSGSFPSPADLVTRAIDAGDLSAGSLHVIPVPLTNERFLRVYYTLGGTTPSMTVTTWLTDQEPQAWRALPGAL
ncbi:MAG: Bbp16 family capsid cement protein [Pseudomonadota bacterium]